MRLPLFLRLDLAGCLLYIGAFLGASCSAARWIDHPDTTMGQVLSWI